MTLYISKAATVGSQTRSASLTHIHLGELVSNRDEDQYKAEIIPAYDVSVMLLFENATQRDAAFGTVAAFKYSMGNQPGNTFQANVNKNAIPRVEKSTTFFMLVCNLLRDFFCGGLSRGLYYHALEASKGSCQLSARDLCLKT